MEHFSKLAEFGFAPIKDDSDERDTQPTYLNTITKLEPDDLQSCYDRHTSKLLIVGSLSPAGSLSSGLEHLQEYSERCSSVETVSSVRSAFTPSPVTVFDGTHFDNVEDVKNEEIDLKSCTEHQFYRSGFNTNGKRKLERTDNPAKPKKAQTQKPVYKRYPKPPYTYVGLIITAIQNSKDKQLTLHGVHDWLKDNFMFFRGEYTGWKDSVRHNLSSSNCFYKDNLESTGKGNLTRAFWKVDLSKVTVTMFRRQENPVGKSGMFAPFLHEELGLPPIIYPYKIKNQTATGGHKPPTGKQPTPKSEIDSMTNVNVELPKKYRLWSTTSESPEVLRHSSTVAGSTDTPKTTVVKTGTNENVNPSESVTPFITPAISRIIDYLTSAEQNIPTQDAVQNLSLLCTTANYHQPDIHSPFNNRHKDATSPETLQTYSNHGSLHESPSTTPGSFISENQHVHDSINTYPSFPTFHQDRLSSNHLPHRHSPVKMYSEDHHQPSAVIHHHYHHSHPLHSQAPPVSDYYNQDIVLKPSSMMFTPFHSYGVYPASDTTVNTDGESLSTFSSYGLYPASDTTVNTDGESLSTFDSYGLYPASDTTVNTDVESLSTFNCYGLYPASDTTVNTDGESLSTFSSYGLHPASDTTVKTDIGSLSTFKPYSEPNSVVGDQKRLTSQEHHSVNSNISDKQTINENLISAL